MNDEDITEKFESFEQKMTAEGLPKVAINTFRYYYNQLVAGNLGLIREQEIEPVTSLPDAEKLDQEDKDAGTAVLSRTIVIKLNGGLGTSMGLDRAKTLITVKNRMCFLDIIARQSIGSGVPMVLMNSFATRDDSLNALQDYHEFYKRELPLDFVQHKVPKINSQNLQPVEHPQDPQIEWCPPGHGDLYTAMITSGILKKLLALGYEYAFISNADNLGATIDESILGYFIRQDCPFMMEVADRTESDKKGGHLARTIEGKLILRESAQCKDDDIRSFQDIRRHRYFNTNNLWLNLKALDRTMKERNNILGLPLICNKKNVDPRDEKSIAVYQLETAIGAAISVFDKACAIRVPRIRFAPVKTTNDLLVVRSDAYQLDENYMLVQAQGKNGELPVVNLDDRYFQKIDSFEKRFSSGIPSLRLCTAFIVVGDISFGEDVVARGKVNLVNNSDTQQHIAHKDLDNCDIYLH